MKTVFAYPGNMPHAQHAARALFEAGSLAAFVTTYVYRESGLVASLLSRLPAETSKRLAEQFARRSVIEVPVDLVHSYPMWEILRSAIQKAGASPAVVDALWDRSSHSFDALVARRYVPTAEAVQGFEYTALAMFGRAKEKGIGRILHIPSLDNAQSGEVLRREKAQWKELSTKHDAYFDRKFPRRHERRLREIALADVIIANSSLTARSHIAAGADPAKVFAVPLGAPTPIAEVKVAGGSRSTPLNVMSAGSFSVGKGSHYLLKAWRRLNLGTAAVLNVYGRMALPDSLVASGVDGVVFHGSVPRPALYRAYEAADVLVFPTLSDGFGSVIAEALAHGLPVITTNQAGAADLLTPESGIIVPVANSDALVDALRWCLDNRVRLQEMRLAALAAAHRRQWSDFRRDLIASIETGLRRNGYSPTFRGAV